tara:strand:- start:333 stop:446 length:114 start_codon:yes stop_codon:yes gene_type:complete
MEKNKFKKKGSEFLLVMLISMPLIFIVETILDLFKND